MTAATQPFFVVSAGHSGDAGLASLFIDSADADLHHNYMAQIHRPLGVHRYMNLVDDDICRNTLRETTAAAIHYCEKPRWMDFSPALALLITPLAQLFPEARFVHLVRDGRSVVTAYGLYDTSTCYTDRATSILQHHYDGPENYPAPPPEARFWWPLPHRDHPIADRFRLFSQFERIAWHWAEVNRVIVRGLSKLDQSRYIRVHLEDLLGSPLEFRRFVEFLGHPYTDELYLSFAAQHQGDNNHRLSIDEARMFKAVAWEMMELLGYASTKEAVSSH